MNDLPDGADTFLADAGWGSARAEALTGDASFRRYWRLTRGDDSALLMHAPPPNEDIRPFVRADRWLRDQGLRAPEIHAEDDASGFVLLEDFGSARMRDYLDEWPQDEADTYRGAIDALVELHTKPAGPFPDYSWAEYAREVRLFTEWYCPAQGLDVDDGGYVDAWQEAMLPVLRNQRDEVTVRAATSRPNSSAKCSTTTCRRPTPAPNSRPITPGSVRSGMPRSSASSPACGNATGRLAIST